ncbi:abhydrolase domain-containing 18 [Persicimonas caeni]|uniref:Abhydrolase domain-containing 18 n=1 Tax=Persicimonas caeni TaxID=2292766 RepID=A0A4Y6PMR8_PERCE|nr:alpha/beta fold hydrolase [Persicimonas caeni]QDG49581.1 abhydrolase domain-containing 18 [Persicimonas caeni]QED30802.1 abhydrolase domain-containing 18 [Persicimonas caeni]
MDAPSQPYDLLDRDFDDGMPGLDDHEPWTPGMLQRVLSWNGALVDRAALNLMERLFLSESRPDLDGDVSTQIEQIRDTYADAHLLDEPEGFFETRGEGGPFMVRHLGDIPGGERLEVSFESGYHTFDPAFVDDYGEHSPNEMCTARIWRHREGAHPTILCLHCWCGGRLWMEEHIFAASCLYRDGFDVALMTLPFHGPRTPQGALFSGQMFPSRDLRRTNEAFGQAVFDVHTLIGWLRGHGAEGPIGLMGISLGGYTASLLASVSDDFDFVVPVIAPSSFSDLLWWHGQNHPQRQSAEASGLDLEGFRQAWAVHSPLSHELRVPKDRVLIVGAAGDRIVRPAQVLALWEHWDCPEIRWFSGSHLAHFGRFDYIGEIREWLKQRVVD